MKYSLTKQVDKKALVELFIMLSDSIDESIPDIIWEGSEFEVDISQDTVKCDVDYISTKKGGEFKVMISWITPEAKKQKAEEAEKKTKERLAKEGVTVKTSSTKEKTEEDKPLEVVSDAELWSDEEENWDDGGDDAEWDSEDYDEEW
ncbi:MAG: hypothetical protein JXA54_00115 [Candidatus Heimdallarchaeota archaeon]|nr:hypothetical protein [Candidatus Heimdallarchaeota archaeon]